MKDIRQFYTTPPKPRSMPLLAMSVVLGYAVIWVLELYDQFFERY